MNGGPWRGIKRGRCSRRMMRRLEEARLIQIGSGGLRSCTVPILLDENDQMNVMRW